MTILFVLLSLVYPAQAQSQPPIYSVRSIAGSYLAPNLTPAAQAALNSPVKIISDRKGGYYIAGTNLIYSLDPAGRVSVIAGSEGADISFSNGAPATRAFLSEIWDIALNKKGELHYVDAEACLVRRIDAEGLVWTVAGNGRCEASPLQNVQAAGVSLDTPRAIAFDSNDNLFISETFNLRIRMVQPNGNFTTLAGNGTTNFGEEGAIATSTSVVLPQFLTVDSNNNLIFVEYGYCRVRKIDRSNPQTPVVTTIFENLQRGCFQGGTNPQAMSPIGVAISGDTLYVSEDGFHRVSAMVNKATFRVTAGDAAASAGFAGDGGAGAAARLNSPMGLSVDDAGNLLIADTGNHRIRSLSPGGTIRTLAGISRFGGDNGPASGASLLWPRELVFDRSGNLFFTDEFNHVIRKIDRAGVITTAAGTPGISGRADGPPRTARLNRPRGLAVDSKGVLYFSDWGSDRIRKVDVTGEVSTINSVNVTWRDPAAIAISSDDLRLYVADAGNHQVRVIDLATYNARTIAGNGQAGFAGDLGPATLARLWRPEGLTLDRSGNLLIADTLNRRVRRVDLSTGIIDTVIGNGEADAAPSGPARQSGLVLPSGLAADASGNIIVASAVRSIVRFDAASGTVSTIAGRDASLGFGGDGGLANAAAFSNPWAVRLDAAGNILVADTANHRIRILEAVTPSEVRLSAGNNQAAPANGAAAAPLRVQVRSRTGVPLPGVAVTFSVVSGGARLSGSRIFTDREGLASVTVTMGPTPGPVQIRAAADGVAQPVTFTLTALAAPSISSGGVTGAGELAIFTPGSTVRIRGENLAAAAASGLDNTVAGALPTSLAGTCVTIGGLRAPLLRVAPTEIVAVVPRLDVSASVELKVVSECGTPLEFASQGTLVKLAAAAPEFLPSTQTLSPGAAVTLLALGLGDTDPSVEPGSLPAGPAPIVQPFTFRLRDTAIPAAHVEYIGLSATTHGVYEVRFRVPEDTEPGDATLTLTVGDATSPPLALGPLQ